jgi:hypothetical protein
MKMEKHFLQSKFTLLKSKFFPAKITFSKIQKKIMAEKELLCKGSSPIKMTVKDCSKYRL